MVKVIKATKKDSVNTAIVLTALEKQAAPYYKKLKSIDSIESQKDVDAGAEALKAIKEIGKLGEAEQQRMLDPVKETAERIREHFQPFFAKIKEVETTLKLKISIYLKNNEKKIARVDEDFENGKIKKIGTYAAKIADLQVKNSSTINVRKIKKLKIVNASIIPREFMIPDEAKIFEALKGGKKIAGCEIEIIDSIAI